MFCTSAMVYSQIWLYLSSDDHHFFFILPRLFFYFGVEFFPLGEFFSKNNLLLNIPVFSKENIIKKKF